MSQFICVVIEIATELCIGVDFCKDLPALRRKAAMYRADAGSGCVVMEYPPQEADILMAMAELTEEGPNALAQADAACGVSPGAEGSAAG